MSEPATKANEWNKLIQQELKSLPNFSTAQKHLQKNRYTNVLANEDTRVELKGSPGYINANFIYLPNDEENQPSFIATQGPLANTVYDFWLMILEQNVTEIVMLANVEERFRSKCHKYWPDEGKSMQVTEENDKSENPATISIACESTETHDEVVLRQFKVSSADTDPREVSQLQFVGWPDHGVPENTDSFRRLVEEAFNKKQHQQSKSPIVAHCSAGIGRTGTFMTVYDAWRSLRQQKQDKGDEGPFIYNVYEVVKKIKGQRYGSVQQRSQYDFIYKMIQEEAKQLNIIDKLKFESYE